MTVELMESVRQALTAALWGFHWTGDAAEMAERLERELDRLGYRLAPAEGQPRTKERARMAQRPDSTKPGRFIPDVLKGVGHRDEHGNLIPDYHMCGCRQVDESST